MSLTKSTRGFTLIELLIVIAIIGILAATVIFSLNTAREKARDSQVKTDVRSMMNALEVYKTDATVNLAQQATWATLEDYDYTGTTSIQGSTIFSGQSFTHPQGPNTWVDDEWQGYAIKIGTANAYAIIGKLIALDTEYFEATGGTAKQQAYSDEPTTAVQ